MLHVPSDFPFTGSRGYLRGSADPVTILRHNADGTALVRREPRPLERATRPARSAASPTGPEPVEGPQRLREDIAPAEAGAEHKGASGNTTVPRADLFETPEEAALQNTPRQSRRARRSAR